MVGPSLGLAHLRRWMARRRLSQTALALLLGVDQSWCCLVANGKRLPNVILAGKIERLTGGSVKAGEWSLPYRGALPELPEHRGRRRRET